MSNISVKNKQIRYGIPKFQLIADERMIAKHTEVIMLDRSLTKPKKPPRSLWKTYGEDVIKAAQQGQLTKTRCPLEGKCGTFEH